jgi:hypothetical protein
MSFKRFLIESSLTMTLWHGGNLDNSYRETMLHKSGRWEYGPGLYLTTHYDTAAKYAKGSRKLYKVEIAKGNDINDMNIPIKEVNEFCDMYIPKPKRREFIDRVTRNQNDVNQVFASIFLNVLINGKDNNINYFITKKNTENLRSFLIASELHTR